MNKILLLATTAMLSGCVSLGLDTSQVKMPAEWTTATAMDVRQVESGDLHQWWQGFGDPVLNSLVETALRESPDRLIAESKITEARGLRRTARGDLFPQISGAASAARRDEDITGGGGYPDNFYDAGFDASYEIDLFGKNQSNLDAADAGLKGVEADYNAVTLTLVAEVTRSYIDYRAGQEQKRIAEKNLHSQEKTFSLVRELNKMGEAPRLDVERAENLVNTTRASIPEYNRLEQNARLRLSVLTGQLPADLKPVLETKNGIPGGDVQPVLMSPAKIIALRPDIRAASYDLSAAAGLAESAGADFFPAFTISGFYGVTDSIVTGGTNIWNVAAGTAVSLLDFGRIGGRVDAANAREKQAFELYRKTVLQAVVDVETALNDYANINAKQVSLQKAFDSADRALALSQTLYGEGEISFLDVLDAQRSVNAAEAALISAKAAQSESLVRLYKSLGVY